MSLQHQTLYTFMEGACFIGYFKVSWSSSHVLKDTLILYNLHVDDLHGVEICKFMKLGHSMLESKSTDLNQLVPEYG